MITIRQQRQEFETELRTYKGDDPLDVWTRYISWIEQTFPKGGKESHIDEILHKCVTAFRGDERYNSDTRFLDIWIKFASICTEPLEIYKYMFDNKIGHKLASFYEAWASELESLGNTKKADTVYIQGLENGAEPQDLLRRRQGELHARVARRVAGELVAPPEPVTVFEEPCRHALGALRGRQSGKKVPVERASTTVQGSTRMPQNSDAPNTNRPGFQILSDENADPANLMQSTGEWLNIPTKGTHKENTQKAGVWTKGKMKQRNTPVVKLSEISSVSKPEFSVYTDVDDLITATPQGKHFHYSSILSAKKPEKYQDPFDRFQQDVGSEPGVRLMYPKEKVYCGGLEFQLEEIRAFKWIENQRQVEKS
ncbi:hypothetical protein LSH36_241g07000 [Paralvinella palmiformis]|uniref:BUB1 N-terminal domain-containing protein n=1 Tax=Paralvinella palmiformis TaxID=53620 RepID=A0AAD9JLI3_9ANNE|nr:hypothetical protein LSH36_241g07000 [Paralvinella palmiformis]